MTRAKASDQSAIELLEAHAKALEEEVQRVQSDFMRVVIANAEVAKLNAEQAETIERLRGELETERLRLAGCGVAALSDTPKSVAERLTRDSPYWSVSYGDVCHMVDRLMEMRAALHGVGRWLHSKEGTSLPQPLLDQINAALRGAAEPKPLPTESAKGATAAESTPAPPGYRG